jgi:protein-L-isoaspartate O-methyltransferase
VTLRGRNDFFNEEVFIHGRGILKRIDNLLPTMFPDLFRKHIPINSFQIEYSDLINYQKVKAPFDKILNERFVKKVYVTQLEPAGFIVFVVSKPSKYKMDVYFIPQKERNILTKSDLPTKYKACIQ